MRHGGFTLLEMVVVVLVLGLLSSVAVLQFGHLLGPAEMNDAADRLRHADAICRAYSRRFGRPVELTVNAKNSILMCRDSTEPALWNYRIQLPRGARIYKVWSSNSNGNSSDPPAGVTKYGEISIIFGSSGLSHSYAVEIGRHDARQGGNRSRWLFVAGLTGQVTEVPNEHDMDEIFHEIKAKKDGDGQHAD